MGLGADQSRAAGREKRLRTFLRTISLNWRGITFWVLAGTLALFNWDWLAARASWWWQGLGILFQFVLAMTYMIVQFGAIFWFLGRARIYWINAGETGVSFDDYRGNPEVVEVSRRVVTLLRGVKKFKQMGGEVSRGLLLVGPPGTGKSYLAQAISTEAGVPFAYASAPSFQSMFMGMGNLKVMNLYRRARKQAKKYGACIVFIDEIDAIGTARGASTSNAGMGMGMGGLFGGNAGLLNELLLQMDPPNIDHGFFPKLLRKLGLRTRKSEQPVVFTIGATNLVESLDKALLRPGRFDRKIVVDLPDFDGRKDVLKYYLDKVKHDPNLNLDRMAGDTIGYSPVQIKFVVNEAVVHAHFDGRDMITYKDFSKAREYNEWGLRQPIRSMSYDERQRIAYHEAGHCVAMYLLQPKSPPIKATIIRHGGFLGAVQPKPLEERYTQVREELLADIQIALASRAAERLFLNVEMTGVTGDLRTATRIAAAYLGWYGMGGSLYSSLAFNEVAPDPRMKAQIEKLLDEQYQMAARLLSDHAPAVHAIAEGLLEREELDVDEIRELIEDSRVPAAAEAAD